MPSNTAARTPYQLVVVENDLEQAEAVMQKLGRCPHSDEYAVVHLPGAYALRDYIQRNDPTIDILLIDINLGENEPDGVRAVQKLFPEGSGTQVIYATESVDYCVRVYQTDHIYTLIKPVPQEDLDRAIDKAFNILQRSKPQVLTIKKKNGAIIVPIGEIDYIESNRRKVCIHSDQGEAEGYAALASIAEQLPPSFMQCHKSFLVNMDRVAGLSEDSVQMRSGESVPVSQKRRKLVRDSLAQHLGTSI